MMDESDSRKLNDRVAASNNINNNTTVVERNIFGYICRPIRRLLNIFFSLFRNTYTDVEDGRARRSLRLWTHRIRNVFRRNSDVNTYEVNKYPRLTLPKIPMKCEYDMTFENRGIALIFNQEYFEKNTLHGRRIGTDVDLDALRNSLEKLDFEVMHFSDLRLDEIVKKLEKVSLMDHSKNDCLLITIMTHGELNRIFSRDEAYHLSLITSFFTDENCPSLKGKPRLFLIQSCRGPLRDPGFTMQHSTELHLRRINMGFYEHVDVTAFGIYHPLVHEPEMVHNPPNHPDFLVVRSTMPNYVSFRNTVNGSWFIQDLCTELNCHATVLDFLTLMTLVNKRVSLRESHPQKEKQILCISSMLTKRLIFHPKNKLNEL